MTTRAVTPPVDPRSLLILAGAGGFGRETLQAARACQSRGTSAWHDIVFADDSPDLQGSIINGARVLGSIQATLAATQGLAVITAARARGRPSRREIHDRLLLSEPRWARVIHPDASLDENAAVGRGTVVLAGTVATADVTIGNHVAVMPRCVLTHDVVLGDYVTLASGVCLGGGVTVESEAYIGAGATVREGCRVGAGSLIGMGAVVLHDVPPGQVWVGNPARFLRASSDVDQSISVLAG